MLQTLLDTLGDAIQDAEEGGLMLGLKMLSRCI